MTREDVLKAIEQARSNREFMGRIRANVAHDWELLRLLVDN